MTEKAEAMPKGDTARSRVRIVLVRPRGAGNVGSVARAMKNMGLHDLVLVRPSLRRRFWATAMAVHAVDLLDAARTVQTLDEAVADCGFVLGTTCRRGPYRSRARTPRELAPQIVSFARSGPVAIVFGPEDHGLSNHDLRCCQQLIHVRTESAYPSLNLAQAVLLCCYEIRQAEFDGRGVGSQPARAPAGDVEFAYQKFEAALLRIGFLNTENPDHIMFAFRRMFGRSGLEPRDVRILLGLARQIEWYGRSAATFEDVS